MSLKNLPAEVFHLISERLDRRDHLSLFLVSKKIRSYAQSTIQLHSELVITWSGHVGSPLDAKSDFPDERRRNKFFRIVKSFPHLLSYLTSLSLLIDPSTCDETTHVGQATIKLLSGAVRLWDLRLTRPHVTGSGSLSFALLDGIPSSVTRLQLEGSPINTKGLKYLLASCPSIRTLDLTRTGIIESDDSEKEEDLRFPQTLTSLHLPEGDDAWHPSLRRILSAMSSLADYSGCFFSVSYLIPLDLSRLTSLSLTSAQLPRLSRTDSYPFGSQPSSMAEVTSTLAALLDKTPELIRLQIDLGASCGPFDHAVPPVTIIDHLPARLQSLSLKGSDFYTSHDLLRYLTSSARSSRLSTIELPLRYYKERDESVVELCEDRGVKVKFDRWRPCD